MKKLVLCLAIMSIALQGYSFNIGTNSFEFVFEDTSWVAVRPSGTEPKCKFYFCIAAENKELAIPKLAEFKAMFEKNC